MLQGKKDRASVVIQAEKHLFMLTGDILALLDRAAMETIPSFRDDKVADQLTMRNAQVISTLSSQQQHPSKSACLSHLHFGLGWQSGRNVTVPTEKRGVKAEVSSFACMPLLKRIRD